MNHDPFVASEMLLFKGLYKCATGLLAMCVSRVSISRPNTLFHAKSWSLYAKVSVLLSKCLGFIPKSLSRYVPMSTSPSCPSAVRCWGWGVLHAWSALCQTSGWGGFEWVRFLRFAKHLRKEFIVPIPIPNPNPSLDPGSARGVVTNLHRASDSTTSWPWLQSGC